MTKELLNAIKVAYTLEIGTEKAWQAFWAHFGITSDSSTKRVKSIPTESVKEVFLHIEEILKTTEQDNVKNQILDGISNILVYTVASDVEKYGDVSSILNTLDKTYSCRGQKSPASI